jgi:hypothetical protein
MRAGLAGHHPPDMIQPVPAGPAARPRPRAEDQPGLALEGCVPGLLAAVVRPARTWSSPAPSRMSRTSDLAARQAYSRVLNSREVQAADVDGLQGAGLGAAVPGSAGGAAGRDLPPGQGPDPGVQ